MIGTLKYLLGAMAVVILLVWLVRSGQTDNKNLQPEFKYKITTISIGSGPKTTVMLADTPEKQALGLSGVRSIGENEGMLFIFSQPIIPGFWVKDMSFAIDMIWIDANKKIIGIHSHISPDSFPQKFSPQAPILYVLEVNAGWTEKNEIKIGDIINF